MRSSGKWLGMALAAVAVVPSVQANAAMSSDEAEKLRRLDIMLMVSSLRCRSGADDFRVDYQHFTTRHIDRLNQASQTLKGQLTARYGDNGAKRELDRMSVTMANRYGVGHPWMSCAELKKATADLAASRDSGVLLAAADEMLSERRGTTIALAGTP